jgi:two-component system cell cycle sensor histidine kinase PleC
MSQLTPELILRGRGGVDAALLTKRRLQQRELAMLREKLTSSSGLERAFDSELLRVFSANWLNATLATLLFLVGALGLAALWLPVLFIGIAAGLIAAGLAATLWLARSFLAHPTENAHLAQWRSYFIVAQVVFGSGWAMLIFSLTQSEAASAHTFSLVLLLAEAALSAMLGATVPNAVRIGQVPIVAAAIGLLILQPTPQAITLALVSGATFVFFAYLAERLYASAIGTITARSEKDALIAELETAKANSDEARRRAEESNLAKSRFLATMSHELRTPLNAILGFSDVMASELMGRHSVDAYRDYAKDIHASGEHLLNIINEILDLSRVEAGRYELREEAIHLGSVAEECRHMLQMRAKAKAIRVMAEIDPSLEPLWADEKAVRQICLNLLSNAIKFTPQNGDVKITIGRDGQGGQKIEVSDTGPGIPEKELPLVLESFGRGSLAIKTAEQGTGLGLPIVKGLIDLHGGTLDLQSKLREGTRVIVRFPAARTISALNPLRERRSPTYALMS